MKKIAKENSDKNWIFLKENANIDAKTIFLNYKKEFDLGNDDSFVLYKTIQNTDLPAPPIIDGTEINPDFKTGIHYKFQQYYKGLPVEHCIYIVHESQGKAEVINGNMVNGLTLDVNPSLTEEEALNVALNELQSTQYFWENEYFENKIKKNTGDSNATYFPKGELLLASLNNKFLENSFSLAYKFDIYAQETFKSVSIYINAANGNIIKQIPLFASCNPATVNTIWDGNRSINTECASFCTSYFLQDDCDGGSIDKAVIEIDDWNSTTTTSNPVNITSSTNTWTSNNQRFGATVLWAAKRAYWYFKSNFNRDSYDNSNGNVQGYINAVFNFGSGPTTANATMSFSGGIMSVGLGTAGTLADSWAPLDIISHEYAHAVTGSEANLVYQGESGALNESFSDIFGEMTENHTLGSNDWLVGADRTSGAIRSLSNPNANSDPDTYQGTFWASTASGASDNGGVHTNSGVQNFWFNLLSTGGNGTNDNGDYYNVPALYTNQQEVAAWIAYTNLCVYLTSSSDYDDARSGSIQAAESAYGLCSDPAILVGKAWHAVGVGMDYTNSILCFNINPTSGDRLISGISTLTVGCSTSFTPNITPNNSGDVGLSAGDYVDIINGVTIKPSGSGYARISTNVYDCTAYTNYPVGTP
jgi:Zn-dependent metalloprotease